MKDSPTGVLDDRYPRTLDELFALGEAVEAEAARRYAVMAATLAASGNAEVAALFRELEREEQGHARYIGDWAEAVLGRRTAPAEATWRTPEGAAVEDLDRDPRLLTPYRALNIAVHNEERAFAFYSYIAANAEDTALRQQAEAFAREELEHAARLRRQRRRAYHAERRAGRRARGWDLEALRPTTDEAFHAAAAALEQALADRHAACAEAVRAADGQGAEALAEAAREAGEMAARLRATLPPDAALPPVQAPEGTPLPADCILDLEEAYEFYMAAAESVPAEDAMAEAQALAEATIARIARLTAAARPAEPG